MGSTEGNTDGSSSMRYQRATSEVESASNRVAGMVALEGGPQMRINRDKQNIKKKSYVLSSRDSIDTLKLVYL